MRLLRKLAPTGSHLVASLLLVSVACEGPPDDSVNGPSGPAAESDQAANLTIGAHGVEVRELHSYLTRFGYFPNVDLARRYPAWRPLVADAPAQPDVFDARTALALRALQARAAIPVSGALDPATRTLIATPRCGVPDGIATLDSSDKFSYWARFPQANAFFPTTIGWNVVSTDSPEITLAQTRTAVSNAVATWAARTSLSFSQDTTTFPRFDVVIGNLGGPGGVLAVTAFLNDNQRLLELDPAETWSVNGAPGTFDLQSVLVHEIGHVLGLDHSGIASAVMFPFINPGVQKRVPALDDNAGVSSIWDNYTPLPSSGGSAAKGKDVAMSPAGEIWKIGTNAVTDGFQVYKWSGSSWTGTNGGGVRIAVDPSGIPWIVTTSGKVLKRSTSSPSGGTWAQMGGAGTAKDIGIALTGDSVWIVGAGAGDQPIKKRNGSTWSATADGTGVRLAVSPSGKPWVVDSFGLIRRRLTTDTTSQFMWEILPGDGPAVDVGIGVGENAWGLFRINNQVALGVWNEQPQVWNDTTNSEAAPYVREWELIPQIAFPDGAGWNVAAGQNDKPVFSDNNGTITTVLK